MSDTRLTMALAGASLPEGTVAVFRPPMDHDLSALPRENLAIVQGFRPDYDAWVARGFAVAAEPPEDFAAAIVVVPRAKAEARALIARAARGGGPVIVDGLKTHGVESLLKDLRSRGAVGAPVSKAHGKAFVVTLAPGAVDDWHLDTQVVAGWHTAPGVFSADGPDPGSEALVAALPTKLSGKVADLGAGWGFLAHGVLQREGVSAIDLVEAEAAALEAARRNVTDPRARFHWADALGWEGGPYDHVVMNPPFHVARSADPALGRSFVARAAQILKPSGVLWMVANRHLPYEATLATAFREVTELPGPPAYKLLRASGSIVARKRR